MLPIESLATCQLPHGESMILEKRGDEYFLRSETGTLRTSRNLDAGLVLSELVCHPVRPAKQPRVLITSRSMGEYAVGAFNVLSQKKGQVIIHDPAKDLAQWQNQFFQELYPEILEENRLISSQTPLRELIKEAPEGWHGIVADLDALAMTNPSALPLFTRPDGLRFCAENIRTGSLLGILPGDTPVKPLMRLIEKSGFQCTTDRLPLSTKARRPRLTTVLLAKKGNYVKRSEFQRRD